jgi:hypothetical protein
MVENYMSIDNEPKIRFINDEGVDALYTIKELVGIRETCSDEDYSKRIATCKSCSRLAGTEICTENSQLVRVFCRLSESKCPKNLW